LNILLYVDIIVNEISRRLQMPLYEYKCEKCGYRFEEIRPIGKADESCLCPECGEKAKRIQSLFGLGSSSSKSGGCSPQSKFT
jgi:putative FmdB family regulatory protein